MKNRNSYRISCLRIRGNLRNNHPTITTELSQTLDGNDDCVVTGTTPGFDRRGVPDPVEGGALWNIHQRIIGPHHHVHLLQLLHHSWIRISQTDERQRAIPPADPLVTAIQSHLVHNSILQNFLV